MMPQSERRKRLIQIFGHEKDGYSILWDNPSYFSQPGGQSGKMLDEAYDQWISTKREFTKMKLHQVFRLR